LDRIEVGLRYDDAGQPLPLQFTWGGRVYRVEEIGRRWQEEGELHILCMAAGRQVYELVYDPVQGEWRLGHRPPPAAAA
jgi:hypothetical protein